MICTHYLNYIAKIIIFNFQQGRISIPVIIFFSGQSPNDYPSFFLAVSLSFLRNSDLSSSLSGADENILLRFEAPMGIAPTLYRF